MKLENFDKLLGVLAFYANETDQIWAGQVKAIVKKFDFEKVFDVVDDEETGEKLDDMSDQLIKITRVGFDEGEK